mgnify:CR=1 FL=1
MLFIRNYDCQSRWIKSLQLPLAMLLLFSPLSLWSAAGLWPNSAFTEPKQAVNQTALSLPATLSFTAKKNRLQCYQKPNDEAFYVLSTGGKDFPVAKLHLYQLSPFKLTKTVKLPQLPMPFGRYEDATVLPIANSKSVVIYNVKSIMLFDYERGEIIRKREFKDISKGVVLEDKELTVFFKNPLKRSEIGFKVYNIDNLNLVAKSQLKGQSFASNYRGNSYSWFTSLAGNMVEIPRDMATDPQVVFYDSQTLQPSLIINHRDKQRDSMSNQTFYHVSPDFTKLYISTLYDHRSDFDFTASELPQGPIGVDDNFHIEVDLNSQQLNFDVPHVPTNAIEMPLGHIYFQGLSESNRFVWIDGVFLIDKKQNKIYKFHQFDDGEAILKSFNSDKIMTTPGAIQHLKIKNQYGQEEPLDKASLEQYKIKIE